MNTTALERLRAFRQEISTTFGCRRDALMETLDALLTAPVTRASSPSEPRARLPTHAGAASTMPGVPGTVPLPRLEHLVAEQPLETTTGWYAVDASVWPHCDAETSPDRGYYLHHSRHSNGQPIVASWNYSWRVPLPERCSSWTAKLARTSHAAGREHQSSGSPRRFARASRQRRAGEPCPIFTFDAGDLAVQLGVALAGEGVGILVRLRSGRCFYADPPQGPTGGRTLRHGAKFVCDDPTTWPSPTSQWSAADVQYGWVRIQCWSGLHAIPQRHAKRGTRQARPIVRGTLIRLEVEHLPKLTKAPVPLWLWWWGADPPDLATLWRVYVARFSIEHTFRFFKQVRRLDDAKAALPRGR